jgi:hypothetical protein
MLMIRWGMLWCVEDVKVNHEEEVEDEADYCDDDLGNVEDHKSVILALLQQLKLGTDLTKVCLSCLILFTLFIRYSTRF